MEESRQLCSGWGVWGVLRDPPNTDPQEPWVLEDPSAQSGIQSKRALSVASFKLPALKAFQGVNSLDHGGM